SPKQMEAAHRALDDSLGFHRCGSSASSNGWSSIVDGVDDVSGRASAQLRDADPGVLRSRCTGHPVWLLCVSPGAVQLRVYRWRRTVLVCTGWSEALLHEHGKWSHYRGNARGAAAVCHGTALPLFRK